MADPIEIIQTAITVAQKIRNVVKSIKDGPQEIQALGRETARLHGILGELVKDLDDRAHEAAVDWSLKPLQMSLIEARTLAEDVNTFLDKVLDQKVDGSSSLNIVNWLRHGSVTKVKDLVARFDRFYLSLSTVQSTNNTNTSRRLAKRIARQEILLTAVYTAVQAPLQSAANEQIRGESQLFDEVNTVCPIPTHLGASEIAEEDEAFPFSAIPCEFGCGCRCHMQSLPLIPRKFVPYVGGIYIPPSLISALLSTRTPCNVSSCKRRQSDLFTIKYFLPSWFAEINADIRFRAIPIHFCIRTQRTVGSLAFLNTASLDDVKRMLCKREFTVNDVQPNGFTVLHQVLWRLTLDRDVSLDILSYLTEQSANQEWLFRGLTPVEYVLQGLIMRWRCFGTRKAAVQMFQYNIGVHFHQDIEDAWESYAVKMNWTELHRLAFTLPSSRAAPALASIPVNLRPQVNRPDLLGRTPIHYAIAASPGADATEMFLRAGAVTSSGEHNQLHWAVSTGANMAISPLIRAGLDVCDIDERTSLSVLHMAAYPDIDVCPNSLKILHALIRHGGHALIWDAKDRQGETCLDYARKRVEQNPSDEDSKQILFIIERRGLPRAAQYVELTAPIHTTEEDEARYDDLGLPLSSLIRAGCRGATEKIGQLIQQDAMVNERDDAGRTLLHHLAQGKTTNGYRVALEFVRHGGHGVDWDARSDNDCTALELVEKRLAGEDLAIHEREEAEALCMLLRKRRLPSGERYVYPCIESLDCSERSSVPVDLEEDTRMPGGWQ